MNKVLIGYRLNGKVDRKTIDRVLNYNMPQWDDDMYFIRGHLAGSFVQRAKELGILELWFEPVYENGDSYFATDSIYAIEPPYHENLIVCDAYKAGGKAVADRIGYKISTIINQDGDQTTNGECIDEIVSFLKQNNIYAERK